MADDRSGVYSGVRREARYSLNYASLAEVVYRPAGRVDSVQCSVVK